VEGFVANTDKRWFDFLAARNPEEINFWQPSGTPPIKRLNTGAPFFLKLKAPHNAIAGFGFFLGTTIAPVWAAWEHFQEANGAASAEELSEIIGQYRKEDRTRIKNANIACTMLTAPVFFPEEAWVSIPSDWSHNIVSGKTYDLTEGEGKRLWESCKQRADQLDVLTESQRDEVEYAVAFAEDYKQHNAKPKLSYPRLGQASFRMAVIEAYDQACAVTREHSLPALEAAHIQPHSEDGPSRVENGILLRSDVHKLFDHGYVTVTPDYEFEVSEQLYEDFENGLRYYEMENELWVPPEESLAPKSQFLEWHRDEQFLG
jgi:putative restriction endonuclease